MKKLLIACFCLLIISCTQQQQKGAKTTPLDSLISDFLSDSINTDTTEFEHREMRPYLNKDHLIPEEQYDCNIIYGFWIEPHGSAHHMVFYKDNTFLYELEGDEEDDFHYTGTFKIKGDSVIMKSDDGKRFAVRWWDCWNDKKYPNKYLTKGKDGDWKIYFIKVGF